MLQQCLAVSVDSPPMLSSVVAGFRKSNLLVAGLWCSLRKSWSEERIGSLSRNCWVHGRHLVTSVKPNLPHPSSPHFVSLLGAGMPKGWTNPAPNSVRDFLSIYEWMNTEPKAGSVGWVKKDQERISSLKQRYLPSRLSHCSAAALDWNLAYARRALNLWAVLQVININWNSSLPQALHSLGWWRQSNMLEPKCKLLAIFIFPSSLLTICSWFCWGRSWSILRIHHPATGRWGAGMSSWSAPRCENLHIEGVGGGGPWWDAPGVPMSGGVYYEYLMNFEI